jgi:hypothetical protein
VRVCIYIYLVALAVHTCAAQATRVTPATMLAAPATNDRVMVSAAGAWVDQPISYLNYWTKSGNHLNYSVTNGYVGIGVTPAFKLHLKDAAASYVAQFEGSASTTLINIGSGTETGQSGLVVRSAGGQLWVSSDATTGIMSLGGTSGASGFSFLLGGAERMRLHQSFRLAIGGGYTNPIALVTNTSVAYDDNFATAGNGQGFAFNSGDGSLNYAGAIRNEADNGSLGGNGFLVQADPNGRGAFVLSVTRSNAAKTRLFTVQGNGITTVGNITGLSNALNVSGAAYASGDGSGVAFWTGSGMGIRSTSGAISLDTPSGTGGAVSIRPRTLNNAAVFHTDGRTTLGSSSNNAIDQLQVTGTVLITSTLKLGTTTAIISTGTAGGQIQLFSRGSFQLPTFFTVGAAPSSPGNGDLWSEISSGAGGVHRVFMRANDTNRALSFLGDLEPIKGKVAAAGTLTKGVGLTSSKTATGLYSVSLSTTATDANYAIILTTPDGFRASYSGQSTSGFTVVTRDSAGSLADSEFMVQILAR